MTTITQINWANLTALQLQNDQLSVVLLPELGGKIVSIVYLETGFEVVEQNHQSGYTLPGENARFSDFDASGLDDAFPNIDETTLLYENRAIHYPDHGEIWSRSFDYEIVGETLCLTYYSERFQYTYEKIFELQSNELIIHYNIQTKLEQPLPCLWAFHGLMRYESDMNLLYPEGTNGFVNVLTSEALGALGTRHSRAESSYNFEQVPPKVPPTMVKYYVDSMSQQGQCGYVYYPQGMMCQLTYEAAKLPYLGIWITAGGFRGDCNLALEPATSYYDDVGIALQNGTVHLLDVQHPLQFDMGIKLCKIIP